MPDFAVKPWLSQLPFVASDNSITFKGHPVGCPFFVPCWLDEIDFDPKNPSIMNKLEINDFDESTCELDPELILQAALENPNLVQQITRTRENGIETLVGYFRVEFAPNQKRYVLHVPFVPPFGGLPQVEAHSSDHDDVRIRTTDCQKFGLRVEVILSQSTNSVQSRMVELVAIESGQGDGANQQELE